MEPIALALSLNLIAQVFSSFFFFFFKACLYIFPTIDLKNSISNLPNNECSLSTILCQWLLVYTDSVSCLGTVELSMVKLG